ncbi:putative membrane protein [Golovinomyces cichoracearum]|uniref:Putative membrane protein n=1 Tax=Golovinomyces cichoracearum TaxID=62708 RepID=A0A420IGN7_9PEZI|nr:putative membrane protein [Golovinomyces cichoracearum]
MPRSTPSLKSPKMESSNLPRYQYLTFPTPPPKSCGRPPHSPPRSFVPESNTDSNYGEDWESSYQRSPLPKGQLIMLAVISLVEQTALNSFSPYLPEMISTFPEVSSRDKGIAVGTLASAFALAQLGTSFFWGWLSDRIGRKPVAMFGTLSTAACFLLFGFCKSFSQAILIQVLIGFVNGNQGIVNSCLGEITDKSNQSRAFVYLPVIYGIGAVTGPAVGGLMVLEENPFHKGHKNPFPYLLPNLFSAFILTVVFVLMAFFLEESFDDTKDLAHNKKKIKIYFKWLWLSTLNFCNLPHLRNHFYNRPENWSGNEEENSENSDLNESRSLFSVSSYTGNQENQQINKISFGRQTFNIETITLLATYLVFQLSNVSYNSLYPIFVSEAEPTGRHLSVKTIGLSLSLSGLIAIVFQLSCFGKLKEKIGNKATYRAGLFLLFFSFMITPWIGYSDSSPPFGWGSGRIWLWAELGFVLSIKTIASVAGLASALLLITNTAPSHSTLGRLNGMAQTLSAAGRALGPTLSGGLFSIATSRIPVRGEVLPYSVFGGIAFLGFLVSFGIKSSNLESEEWDELNSHTGRR